MAEVQVSEAFGGEHSSVGEVLQGHVVQEEVGELGHGDGILTYVGHGVVAQIQTCHLWKSDSGQKVSGNVKVVDLNSQIFYH